MKSSLGILWNALLTAIVVTLLAGLFVAAMPPVYRATSIVQGTSEDMLRLHSADFLEQVLLESQAGTSDLAGWLEELMSSQEQGVQLLQQKMFVTEGKQAGWINITVEAQNASAATRFANDIARVYGKSRNRIRLTPDEKAMLFSEVETIDSRLAEFLDMYPEVLRYTQARQRQLAEMDQKSAEGERLLEQQNQYRGLLEAVRREEIGALTEPGVIRASERIKTHETKLADLTSRYGDQHQKMRSALAEKRVAQEQMQQALLSYSQRLEEQIKSTRDKVRERQARVNEIEREVEALDQQYLDYTKLQLERDTAMARYEGMSEEASAEVFARAVTPGNSLGFNQAMLLAFVFLVTFMLMAVLMVVRTARSKGQP